MKHRTQNHRAMFYSRGISKKNVWPRKADTWLQLPVVAKPGRPTPKPLVSSCIKKKGYSICKPTPVWPEPQRRKAKLLL
jgi:hypothetical protein